MDAEDRLITCILPKGVAAPTLRRLKSEKGVVSCYINNARGTGRFTHRSFVGLGDVVEKEMLNIVVEAERADDIFEFVFFEADMNKPHGGIIFMAKLPKAVHFVRPDIPDEEE